MLFKNFKLGTRLLIAFLFVGIIPFAVIGAVSLCKPGAPKPGIQPAGSGQGDKKRPGYLLF